MRVVGQPVDGGDNAIPSCLLTRLSPLAVLLLIRIEKFTSDLIPIQHGVSGIAEPPDGH